YTTLPNGITGPLTSAPATGEAGFDVSLARPGPGEVGEWLTANARAGRTGGAVRGTWGRGTGDVTGLARAPASGAGEAAASPAAYIDPAALTADDEQALAAWLADESVPKALHDEKGPMLALAARGLTLRGVTSDTALAAYLALPGQRSFDLADLALR